MARSPGTYITEGLYAEDAASVNTPPKIRYFSPTSYLEGIATGTMTVYYSSETASGNTFTLDGNAMTVESESATQASLIIPSGSAGAVDFVMTDGNGETDTIASTDPGAFTYLPAPGTPILTSIESAMATTLSGLTTGGGYHYTWGTANQDDKVLQDADVVAEIRLSNEDNMDEPDGVDANSYLNSAYFEITVQTTMDDLKAKPIWAINAYHNKAIDDLKRAFGINYHLSDTCNSIMYRSHDREILQNGDLFTPGKITSLWRVDYAQDREDVSVNANT